MTARLHANQRARASPEWPQHIYRAKRVIYTSDAPEQPAVLQVVGKRVDISMQDEWNQRVPRTQIVVIGAAGSIDATLLEETFAACIVTGAAV
jgi:G3E family GTPase